MKQFSSTKVSFEPAHSLKEFDSAQFNFPFFADVDRSQLKC
jgi:hypothetical protein